MITARFSLAITTATRIVPLQGRPPSPTSTISDPNGAIYMAWGNLYWHPAAQHPDSAIYSYHDTSSGRNRFVVEYYLYENLLGNVDTFEAILGPGHG